MYNKENSNAFNEEGSTEVQETNQKGYSSRYQRIKMKGQRKNASDPLPIRIERAAIIVQKFYRFRLYMRRKLCQRYLQQIGCKNFLMHFQNSRNQQIVSIIQKEVETYRQRSWACLKNKIGPQQASVKTFIRSCIASDFRMRKKMVDTQYIMSLYEENRSLQKNISILKGDRQQIKHKIMKEFSEHEEQQLRQIREESSILLAIVSERSELQRKIKQMLVEISREDLSSQSSRYGRNIQR